ncbi:CASP-like protein 2C2 [Panicum miliaceum]|uniref:CASP-like protein n=1 Tax=Panicum miliaceum TaxID=4540 RepID=A0A3L6S2X5_PANMI|nr:CASP-like protein 2C2 [Panicum miliaceum]
MVAAARASEVKAEGFLRGACAALAAAAAALVGLSTQTETVLLVRKTATVKDVQALWVLAVAAAAAAGYHLLQLLKCLYLGRAGGVSPCRRSSRALAWVCLLLDKCVPEKPTPKPQAVVNSKHCRTVRTEHIDCSRRWKPYETPRGTHGPEKKEGLEGHCSSALPTTAATEIHRKRWNSAAMNPLKACAYTTFATTVAAAQACVIALDGAHALQWTKLCNIYTRFCEQVAGSLVLGMLAAVGTAVLSAVSARNVVRLYPPSPSSPSSPPPPPYAAGH